MKEGVSMATDRNSVKELVSVLDAVEDDMEILSEDELDDELELLGVKPDEAVGMVSDALSEAFNAFKRRKLDLAKEKRLSAESQHDEDDIISKMSSYTREKIIEMIGKFDNAGYAFREQDLGLDRMSIEDLRSMLHDLMITKQFDDNE